MKLRSLAWLLPVIFCCCNKTDSSNAALPVEDFTFTTVYDSVFTCYPNDKHTFVFNVKVLSGDIAANHVTYTVSGLPAGITVTPSTLSVAQLQGGVFIFTIGNLPAGNDTVDFTISSAVYGTKKHKLILKILPPKDYSSILAGTYAHSFDFCQPDSFFNYTSVVSVSDTAYQVKISNIKNLGAGLYIRARLSDVITVPMQTIGSYTIWGRGTYFKDTGTYYKMLIDDTMVRGIDTQYCTIHLNH